MQAVFTDSGYSHGKDIMYYLSQQRPSGKHLAFNFFDSFREVFEIDRFREVFEFLFKSNITCPRGAGFSRRGCLN